jgi:hypothetical protein
VIIRKAQPQEFSTLKKIADEASRSWGYPDHWLDYCEKDFDLSPETISNNVVFVADDNFELQGFYVLGGESQRLEQLWISPQHFGTGVGKELFLHANETLGQRNRIKS